MRFFLFTLIVFGLIGCTGISDQNRIIEIDTKYKDGQLEEAKADAEQFLSERPDNEIGWTLLGHILADMDDDEAAKEAYKTAISLDPTTVEAITGMGILSRRLGEYDQAAEYYYKAISLDPNYAQAYSSLVVIHLKQKDFKRAVDVGKRGYNLDESDPAIASNLAVAYHYDGDTVNRDKYYDIAEANGYSNLESLQKIFSGEYTVFD